MFQVEFLPDFIQKDGERLGSQKDSLDPDPLSAPKTHVRCWNLTNNPQLGLSRSLERGLISGQAISISEDLCNVVKVYVGLLPHYIDIYIYILEGISTTKVVDLGPM